MKSYKILCVCLGNICRSPTAEVVLRVLSQREHVPLIVDSAGISNYHPNKAPDRRSQQHALQRGYDLSALRARQITLRDFCEFDFILAMDHDNLADIQQLAQQAKLKYTHEFKAKIALMSECDEAYLGQAVPDPYYGGAEGFEDVLNRCESHSLAWINYLKRQ